MGNFNIKTKNMAKVCDEFLKESRHVKDRHLPEIKILSRAALSSLVEAMKMTLATVGSNRLPQGFPKDHVVTVEPIYMDESNQRHIGIKINLNNKEAPIVVNGWHMVKKINQKEAVQLEKIDAQRDPLVEAGAKELMLKLRQALSKYHEPPKNTYRLQ